MPPNTSRIHPRSPLALSLYALATFLAGYFSRSLPSPLIPSCLSCCPGCLACYAEGDEAGDGIEDGEGEDGVEGGKGKARGNVASEVEIRIVTMGGGGVRVK